MPAPGFVQRIGSAFAAPTPSALTLPVGTNTSGAGSLLVCVSWGNGGGSVTTLTDTAGNLYVQDLAISPASTSGRSHELWRCAAFRKLTTSDHLSISTSATADHGISAIVNQFTPLAAPDVTNTNFTTSSVTTLAVSVTPKAGDVVAFSSAGVHGSEGSLTVASPYTATGTAQLQAGSPSMSQQDAYDNSPGTVSTTATFTWNTTASVTLLAATYRAGPASGFFDFFPL